MGQSQTIMLYALPVILAVTGVNFPIGLLVYWTFTNLWSFFQQLYVVRHLPTPNTEAERRMHARQIAKGQEPKRLTLAPVSSGSSGAHVLGEDDAPRRTGRGKGDQVTTADGAATPQLNPTTVPSQRLAQGGKGGQRAQPVRRKKSKKQRKKG